MINYASITFDDNDKGNERSWTLGKFLSVELSIEIFKYKLMYKVIIYKSMTYMIKINSSYHNDMNS